MSCVDISSQCKGSAALFQKLWRETDDEIFRMCTLGLQDFAENMEEYASLAKTSSYFFEDLLGIIHGISMKNEECLQDMQGSAFQIVENLAVIMKEVSLREKALPSHVHMALCSFFENSGYWDEEDQTLAFDCYHHKIPLAVYRSGAAS